MSAPLSEDIALRIGLAARALPDIEARVLLRALIEIMGEPITATKLSRLRAGRLKSAANGALAAVDDAALQQTLALLKGNGIERLSEPLPLIEAYIGGDLPGSVRVACASNTGELIDGHFGSCARFLIYQVGPEQMRLIAMREPNKGREPGRAPENEDRNAYRAQLLADCKLLYTVSIGGPAAAKAVRAGLHPIKLNEPANARATLARLQTVLAQELPPPWLQKAMGNTPNVRAFS